MPPLIVIPPDKIAQARRLYESTSVSVHDIAAFLGIGTTTFMKRVKLWEWKPRNLRLADLDAAAKADMPIDEIRQIAEPRRAVLDHAALVDRVRSAVEHEIIAIERTLASVDGVRLRTQDAERAARTLAALVKTLREVNTVEKARGQVGGDAEQEEDQFRDLEDFRRELVARLERIRVPARAKQHDRRSSRAVRAIHQSGAAILGLSALTDLSKVAISTL